MGNVYAYVRVSTTGQHEDRQLIAMARQDVPEKNIFVEKQSGKDFNRPMYRQLMRKVELSGNSGTVADSHQGKGGRYCGD